MQNAAATIAKVPEWPALLAADGGGVIDAWRHISDSVDAGDPATVTSNPFYSANCT